MKKILMTQYHPILIVIIITIYFVYQQNMGIASLSQNGYYPKFFAIILWLAVSNISASAYVTVPNSSSHKRYATQRSTLPTKYRNRSHQRRTIIMLGVSADENTSSNTVDDYPLIVCPGGGIFFYWQAGVMEYLREQQYNLDKVRFAGASAGALTATLAATNVSFYHAKDLALQIGEKYEIWDRPGGLQGGSMGTNHPGLVVRDHSR